MEEENEKEKLEFGNLVELKESKGLAFSISGVMIAISSVALAIMTCVTVADVVGRYFFLNPLTGAEEGTGLLMVMASSLGLGWCQLVKGNIQIDILPKRLSRRGRAILEIFSYLISVGVCALISWQGALMTYDYMFTTLGSVTGILRIKYWPFMLIMVLGFFWVLIVFILDLIRSFKEAVGR